MNSKLEKERISSSEWLECYKHEARGALKLHGIDCSTERQIAAYILYGKKSLNRRIKMKFRTAKELVRIDINTLSLERLQKHKVKVLDAWRESSAEYGMKQAIMDGYYVHVHDTHSNFWTPRDMFLTTNLSYIYEQCVKRERELLRIS